MGRENYLPHQTGCQIKDSIYQHIYFYHSPAQGFINVQSGSNGQDASGTQTTNWNWDWDWDSKENKNRICVLWLKLDLLVWVPWGDCNLLELDKAQRGQGAAGRLCTLHWTLHPSCPPTAAQCLFAGGLYLRLYLYLNTTVWLRISSTVSVTAPLSAAVIVSVSV